jgi:deoxyadenosine/deoxycytidine kinase
VTVDAPVPDLVIYLQAPVDILLKRIARRGIRYERRIDADYLQRLSEAYTRMFLYYDAAPLLIVNAANINLVDSEADYAALLEQIRVTRKGMQYFNPVAEAI